MKVAAHDIGGPGVRWVIEAVVDSIEHANLIEEQDIELFIKHGTYLSDPNLQLFFDDETGFRSFESWKYDWWREKVLKAIENTRNYIPMAMKAGVKICLGTDSTHASLWREAKHLVGIGISPEDALLSITKNTSELLDMTGQVGTLEPGKLADMIAVRGNPLLDITSLKDVSLVIKSGKFYTA